MVIQILAFILFLLSHSLSLIAIDNSADYPKINYFDHMPNDITRLIFLYTLPVVEYFDKNSLKRHISFLLVCKKFNKIGSETLVNEAAKRNKMPLLNAAAMLNQASYIETLIKQDKKLVDLKCGKFLSPLGAAAYRNSYEVAHLLLQLGASNTDEFLSPLYNAAMNDSLHTAKLLLNTCAFVKKDSQILIAATAKG